MVDFRRHQNRYKKETVRYVRKKSDQLQDHSLALIGYLYWSKGVYVSITNNTKDILTNITVSYTGGCIRIARLEPKKLYRQRVHPAGESDLELKWLDSLGVKQSRKIDVYFESNYYNGNIEITINPNNRISVENTVDISFV